MNSHALPIAAFAIAIGITNSSTAAVIFDGDAEQLFPGGFTTVATTPNSTGSLTINAAAQFIAQGVLVGGGVATGDATGAVGTLVVDGPGTDVRLFPLGFGAGDANFLTIGSNGGSGTATFSNDAEVFQIGGGNSSSLFTAVGFGGNGTLNINSGAELNIEDDYFNLGTSGLLVGFSANGYSDPTTSVANVDGVGSTINVIGAAPGIFVGATNSASSGVSEVNASLNITNGANVNVASYGDYAVNDVVADGTATIELGMTAQAIVDNNSSIATVAIGYGGGADASMLVSGDGSRLEILGNYGALLVGSDIDAAVGAAQASLVITDNAVVEVQSRVPGESLVAFGLGNGNATVEISNGGQLITDGTVFVSTENFLSGNDLQSAILTIDSQTVAITAEEVIVGARGVLQGSGIIDANLTNAGGTIGPGFSPGTLNILGDYTQTEGSLIMEVAGIGPGLFDQLIVGGALNFLGGEIIFDLTEDIGTALADINFFIAADGVFFGSSFGADSIAFRGVGAERYSAAIGSDGMLKFDVQAVPEPSTLALLTIGLAFMFARRRRLHS